jgi:hypothetical protein
MIAINRATEASADADSICSSFAGSSCMLGVDCSSREKSDLGRGHAVLPP